MVASNRAPEVPESGDPEAPAESARRARTRARLLDAAFEVFAEVGVHAASVEQICDRAGFTRGAFYSNFAAKEELFAALVERENTSRLRLLAEGVERYLGPLARAGEIPDDAVGGIVSRFLQMQGSDQRWPVVRAEFELLAMRDPAVAASYLDYQERFLERLTGVLVDALALTGRCFRLDAADGVRTIVGICDDAMRQAVLDRSGPSPEARVVAVLPGLLLALTTRRRTASSPPSARSPLIA